MDLDRWSHGDADPTRRKRLAVGYAAGLAICALVGVAGATMSRQQRPAEEDETVDVKLATTVEAKPEPPPPPPPKAVTTPQPASPGPRKRELVAPTEVPTEKPPEADPGADKPSGDGDPYAAGPGGGGVPGGIGTGPATTAVVTAAPPPPPPPAPKAQGPIQLPETATPPVALSNAQPPYPDEARRQGVEATVVVKFVVTESGEVTNVTIVRGHPMFDALVLSTVRGWRYKPAVADGRPISVFRIARIPFKLKT